jgi:hypothetical protein
MGPYDKQIGGAHYLKFKIQPSEFANKNNLKFAEGNAIKYICRHADKGGKQDLLKAKHYIDMIIERDYPDTPHVKPLPPGFTLTKPKDPDMTPMTEEEEYRNAGITKEEAEKK